MRLIIQIVQPRRRQKPFSLFAPTQIAPIDDGIAIRAEIEGRQIMAVITKDYGRGFATPNVDFDKVQRRVEYFVSRVEPLAWRWSQERLIAELRDRCQRPDGIFRAEADGKLARWLERKSRRVVELFGSLAAQS